MPMNTDGMKGAILKELKLSEVAGMDNATKEAIEERIGLIAGAIVSYIKSNALVSTTVVTTGSAAAQTGTGTGSIS